MPAPLATPINPRDNPNPGRAAPETSPLMGKPLTALAGALVVLAAPLVEAGSPPPETLYHGALIRLEGDVPDKSAELAIVDRFRGGPGMGLGFRRTILKAGLAWYRFAVVTDSTLYWTWGDTLALTLGPGRVVAASEQFVMSPPPEQRPLPLAGDLRTGGLWRVRVRGGVATVVFAGFPRLWGLGANPDVRVGVMVKTRSPATLERAEVKP